jgi:nitroimidazol reductase NimA-like FMN-containing flavoprotein (pyridoxamine 5'-phosphate oxidase superfamily)
VPVTIDERVFLPEEASFVGTARDCFLATTYEDGRPHVVPISTVLDLDRLIFASRRNTQKIRNIAGNPMVAVCFDEYHEDWSQLRQVIAHGDAYVLDAGFEFERDRTLIYEKFPQYEGVSPIEEGTSVIVEIRLDRITSTWRGRRD